MKFLLIKRDVCILENQTVVKSPGDSVREQANVFRRLNGVPGLALASAELDWRRSVIEASSGIGRLASVSGTKDVGPLIRPAPIHSILATVPVSLSVSPLTVLNVRLGTRIPAIVNAVTSGILNSVSKTTSLTSGIHRPVNA
jgi:hypothetical protein